MIWHIPGVIPPDWCASLAELVEEKRSKALMTPELWSLFVVLVPAIAHLTGPRQLQPLDAAWCWYTEPGATGWPLHRDDPHHGDHLTAWVSLVDIGPRNGAIRWSPYSCARAEEAVSSLEVMPAAAGDVLVWDHATWHCGGRVLPGERPRVCAALEFGRSDVAPGVLDLGTMLRRPELREAALQRYERRYAHLNRAARDLAAR